MAIELPGSIFHPVHGKHYRAVKKGGSNPLKLVTGDNYGKSVGKS